MKKAFNIDGASIFGMIFGLGGLLFAAYQVKKQDVLAKKLDLSIEELEKKTSVEVTDSAVNKALDRAVEREVRSAVADAVRDVKNDIHAELSKTVRKEVDSSFQLIKDQTAEKISEQVAAIDEYALKNAVTKKAEEKILKKFDGSLDGVLGDFRHQLGTVSKVWESVADAMTPRRAGSGSGMTFRLE